MVLFEIIYSFALLKMKTALFELCETLSARGVLRVADPVTQFQQVPAALHSSARQPIVTAFINGVSSAK